MALLERTAELERLAISVDDAHGGSGRIVLVEGPPGMGKTALVAEVRSLAASRGFDVLGARGGELETDFAFGVVRQLFERRLARADADEFEALFAGAASLAAGLFSFGEGTRAYAPPPEDRFALLHGLYWLSAEMASRSPVALVVDDAHWADEPSLQWLDYLARRIEDLPILIVLAARSTEPEAPVPALEAIRGELGVVQLRPSPLSSEAAGTLLGEVFAKPSDPGFTEACHGASGGNPFLLTELAQALAADGVSPDTAGIARLDATNPAGIASLMLVRLGHLPQHSQAMATAAAVLGDGAALRETAALAELDEGDGSEAVDILIAAGFLASSRPIRFQHPLIRAAVYRDLAEADRARRHKHAAHLLRNTSASPERIAAHLLLCEAAGEQWAAETLAVAAGIAMERGSPPAAIGYLRRALEENLPDMKLDLLLALGTAEAQAVDPAGIEHLQEASALAGTSAARVAAIRLLSLLLVRLARIDEAAALISGELSNLRDGNAEVRLELEADRAAILHWGLDEAVQLLDRALAQVPAELSADTPAGRSLLASRAYRAVKAGRPADEAAEDALRALEAGLLDDQGPTTPAWAGVAYSITATDDPSARGWIEQGMARSSATGSRFGTALTTNLMSIIAYREGALADAEAFAWESVVTSRGLVPAIGLPATLSALTNALIERGKAEQAWDELAADGFDSDLPDEGDFIANLAESRGRLKLTLRDIDGGLADLLEAGSRYTRWGVSAPTITRWRSGAAEAYVLAGQPEKARELAREDLEAARQFDRPRPIGIALRALGLALDGDAAIDRLEEAVAVLEHSAARLEHARALSDLGAALRRANRRREAREILSNAVDIASRCGAVVIAERATEELKATGARPRRVMLSGVESLTASELRVARLAAEGLTNREIAQTLFVTDKTVEKHLGNAYGKLEIKSRDELPDALANSGDTPHREAELAARSSAGDA